MPQLEEPRLKASTKESLSRIWRHLEGVDIILVPPFDFLVSALKYTFNLLSKNFSGIFPKSINFLPFGESRQGIFQMFHEFGDFAPKLFFGRWFVGMH